MTTPNMSHDDYHAAEARAVAEQQERVRRDGLMSEDAFFGCLLSPGDRMALRRVGPPGGESTYIGVSAVNHGQPTMIALSVREARRMVATLMNLIDQADPPPAPEPVEKASGGVIPFPGAPGGLPFERRPEGGPR